MTTKQVENEIRALGMRLMQPNTTRAMIDAFDCMVGEFYGREKIGRDTFMWAQEIIGARQ
jgi:hypothetical protein